MKNKWIDLTIIRLSMILVIGAISLFVILVVGSNVNAKTITVDDDGGADYKNIQEAINTSENGDTVRVYDGYYDESIIVNKSISLIGNGSETTTINGGNSNDVVLIEADSVNMSGFNVTTDRYYGTGIKVTSDNNNISHNSIVMNNSQGISLMVSINSVIVSNTLYDSGIVIFGSKENWNSHEIEHNIVNGKPILYYKNSSDFEVPSGAGQVILANCSRVNVENQNFRNVTTGILVGYSSNITLENNTSDNGVWKGTGIYLSKSSFCTISNNTCENNREGIILSACNDIIIKNNKCVNNWEFGIYLQVSEKCTIINNICNNNTIYGQLLLSLNEGIIMNNQCEDNTVGISLKSSNTCTLENNICLNNRGEGMVLSSSNDCTISNNLCVNSSTGIYLSSSSDYCLLKNNTCSMNIERGIYLGSSDYCTLEMNTCENGQFGIYLSNSQYSSIRNTTMIGNGIFIRGSLGQWSHHTIEPSNLVNGKPVIYCTNITNFTVPIGAGQIILAKCSEIIVEDQNCSNVSVGILVAYSSNITIDNNICEFNIDGIYIYFSDNCTIMNNTCSSNDHYGVILSASIDCFIENIKCQNNEDGIVLDSSYRCLIENNIISNNSVGIRLKSISWGNEAHHNNIYGNTEFGIDALNNEYTINAKNNWWGDKSGPIHSVNNTTGTGDNVTDHVIFDPWLDEYYTPTDHQEEDEPDRFLLYIMLVILIFLFIAVEIVVRTPDSVFSRKRSLTPPLPEPESKYDSPEPSTTTRRSITCNHCQTSFNVGENEKAIQVPCPNCEKNNLR